MRKQLRHFFMVLLLAAVTFGASGMVVAAPKLSAKKITISKGEKKKLKVKGTKKAIKWSSSKKKIAQVAKDGTVTGKKKGTAVITAKIGTKKLDYRQGRHFQIYLQGNRGRCEDVRRENGDRRREHTAA